MTSRIYAKLDANRIGPSLLLDQSQLVVTTSEACDIHRMILADLPAFSGRFVYEMYFWSQSQGDLSDLISFGVARVGTDLSLFVGESSDSWGLKLANGEVWNSNASIATVDPGAERIAVGIILQLSPSSCICDFMVNGTSVYQATLPTGHGWLPAISIGSDTASDISASVNFGQNRFDTLVTEAGWLEQSTGLPDITLSLSTEAILLEGGSSGEKVRYLPRLLNGKSASIRRSPAAWFQDSQRGGAAITTLRFDNSRGEFNALLKADLRDADVTLNILRNPQRGVGLIENEVVVFTGVLDSVTAPKVTEVEVTLRDTLTRLDRPMRCRVVPPFYDASSVGKILPIGIGAQRNIQPLLLDKEFEGGLYALGDAPMSNVASASDQAAPLDPYSDPPQFRPANAGSEIVLASAPVGRFAVDCSSVGQQHQIPGDADILDGIGEFSLWDSSGLPDGWEISTTPNVISNGSITRIGADTVQLISNVPYNPVTTNPFYYGFWMRTIDALLDPGSTYRITLNLKKTLGGTVDPSFKFGLAMLWKLAAGQLPWITPYRDPVSVPMGEELSLTFTFTIPRSETSSQHLYLSAIPYFTGTPPTPIGVLVQFADVKIERLGEYEIAPLDGITVKDAFTEILVNREGEDASIFSAEDCEAIDAETGYKLGFRYTDVPNVLNVLQDIADPVGAAIFTDASSVIRIRRLRDPSTLTPVAAFTTANIVSSSVRQWGDEGKMFTTLVDARPNCVPFGAGDFVTDTVTVPADVRAQFQGQGQFRLSATEDIANQYSAARGASRKLLRIDEQDQAQIEINRISIEQFADKAIYISFDALFDDVEVGVDGVATPAHQLYYADAIIVTLPKFGLEAHPMSVVATELFVGQGRINITARYIP